MMEDASLTGTKQFSADGLGAVTAVLTGHPTAYISVHLWASRKRGSFISFKL